MFADGNHNVPGCKCGPNCEMPCWQRVGLTSLACCPGCPDLETPEIPFDEENEAA